MEFEWDEGKRLRNIGQHGIDFQDADLLFEGEHVVTDARITGGERRSMAIGFVNGLYVTAIFTMRGDVTRLISMRRARRGERAQYQAIYGG